MADSVSDSPSSTCQSICSDFCRWQLGQGQPVRDHIPTTLCGTGTQRGLDIPASVKSPRQGEIVAQETLQSFHGLDWVNVGS